MIPRIMVTGKAVIHVTYMLTKILSGVYIVMVAGHHDCHFFPYFLPWQKPA